MGPKRTSFAHRMGPAFWLALIALAAKGLLPTGYMVASGTSGEFAITLCTASGPIDAYFDPETGGLTERDSAPGDHGPDPGSDHCVFAVAGALFAVQAGAEAPPAPARAGAALPLPRFARPALLAAGPPLGARAPPNSG